MLASYWPRRRPWKK